MSCPNCDSDNTRIAENGFLQDTYYCNNCDKSYKKISRVAKGAVVGTVVTIVLTPVIGPIGPIIGGMIGGNDSA